MILFTGEDLFRAIELLEQNDTHEPMGKCEVGKGYGLVRAAQNRIGKPVGATNDQHQPTAGHGPVPEARGQPFGVGRPSLHTQANDPIPRPHTPKQGLSLALHGLPEQSLAPAIGRIVNLFDDILPIARQPFQVFAAAVPLPGLLERAHAQNYRVHPIPPSIRARSEK